MRNFLSLDLSKKCVSTYYPSPGSLARAHRRRAREEPRGRRLFLQDHGRAVKAAAAAAVSLPLQVLLRASSPGEGGSSAPAGSGGGCAGLESAEGASMHGAARRPTWERCESAGGLACICLKTLVPLAFHAFTPSSIAACFAAVSACFAAASVRCRAARWTTAAASSISLPSAVGFHMVLLSRPWILPRRASTCSELPDSSMCAHSDSTGSSACCSTVQLNAADSESCVRSARLSFLVASFFGYRVGCVPVLTSRSARTRSA